MSTATQFESIDMTRPSVPMSRLVQVELRKLVNTRSSFWLVISMAIVAALIMVGLLIWGNEEDLTFGSMSGLMNIPTGFLLPVLAILLVTSEWGQRTALVTFTLEPRRSRVVVAKFITAVIAAVGAVAVGFALGAVGTVLAGVFRGGAAGSWDMTAAGVVNLVILQLAGLFMGFAFAMLIMNSAAAIVLYFVLPTVWSIVGEVVPWLKDNVQEWGDFGFAQAPLQNDQWLTGDEWAHLAVAGTLWLVIPLALGVWRLLRAEVK